MSSEMKALIAMSGGVDSSVAALLTLQQGYSCIGCTMKLYENATAGISAGRTCCSLDDVEDARSVAFKLGMSYYVFNFKDSFKTQVIDRFVEAYENGITPNPCIECNRYMKFEKLYERAKLLSCDKLVTGHYARIEKQGEKYLLKKAVDLSKDQSYVLYSLNQEQLAHMLFPLGELCKTETRKIAEAHGFINASKPDSQDICFVPDGDYAKVIKLQTGKEYPCGDFRNKTGEILGRHKGIINYTIGQRKGLGIAYNEPLYVCQICPAENTVILGKNQDLFSKEALIDNFNWIAGEPPAQKFSCMAKVRYRQQEQPATAKVLPDNRVLLTFDEPQRAITPGQAAVLYAGEIVLGGGEICSKEN